MSADAKSEPLHPEEAITSLLLIRHGHTEATEAGLLYTDPEAKMTTKGIEQAKAIANWIPKHNPHVLIANTAKRVQATADIISGASGMTPVICQGFDEWRVGEWEGRTYWDIKKNDPEIYEAWSKDPITNRPPGGESIEDLCDRIRDNLLALIKTYEGQTVAFVTHAGIIRAILVNALGMSVHNFWRLSIPTGSVSRVDYSANFATVHFVSLRPDM
ncbi:MAG: histidine phosphatase family protein [Cyanobacteria bacterium SZAS-4]|nr:histidine phosphatase family protein [Cyanobacteria bacterium SZAS-4]